MLSSRQLSRIFLPLSAGVVFIFSVWALAATWPARSDAPIKVAAPAKAANNLPAAPSLSQFGSLTYTTKRGDSVLILARRYLSQSSFMTVAELDAAIRSFNNLKSDSLKAGQEIIIPGIEAQPVIEKPRTVAREADLRAVYLTGIMAGSVHGQQIIRRWHDLGGNAVVFDIKDSDGSLSVPFSHP